MICKYFLPGFSLSFHSLNILLKCKCFKFWWSPFVILQIDHAFGVISKNSLLNPRSWRLFSTFSFESFKALPFTFRSMNQFEYVVEVYYFLHMVFSCTTHWKKMFCVPLNCHCTWVWKPKKQECQCLGRRRWIAQLKQKESKFTLPAILCFVWVLKRLDDAYLHWGGHLLYSAHWFKC